MLEKNIFVVGAGKVGTTLALAMKEQGLPLIGAWTRSEVAANHVSSLLHLPCHHGPFPDSIAVASTILLSVPDPVIAPVASALLDGGLLRGAQVILHCAGSKPAAQVLGHIAQPALAVGMFHPLLSIAHPETAVAMIPGAYFGIEGEERAKAFARQLALRLGGHPLELTSTHLTLYHAAAVMASNQAVALWFAAQEVLLATGVVDQEVALKALLPLIKSTVSNVETLGLTQALTGPVRRGDVNTLEQHLEALKRQAPAWVKTYQSGIEAAVRLIRRLNDPELDARLDQVLERINDILK